MSQHHSPVISLAGVEMRRGERLVLDNVDLTVDRGDFIAITGPNGGGKTTLLRIILKLLKPTAGTVTYLDAEGKSVDRISVGYLPQKNMIDSRFPLTVAEVIGSGLLGSGPMQRETRRTLVEAMIDTVGLRSHATSPIGNLSGGQLQRTLLGRALVASPSILVLDEPLSYVDKQMESRIYSIIDSIRERTTIILVSHEMSTIAGMASRHLIVDHGVSECGASHHHVHYDCDLPDCWEHIRHTEPGAGRKR